MSLVTEMSPKGILSISNIWAIQSALRFNSLMESNEIYLLGLPSYSLRDKNYPIL